MGEHRIDTARRDRDQLCDLATVFSGLGIFGANASASFAHGPTGNEIHVMGWTGDWSSHQVGYLGEEPFGFALARDAQLRAESDPPWAQALDTNPRVYMEHATKYLLAAHGPGGTSGDD